MAFTTFKMLRDGTTAPEGDWPAPGETCGVVPEFIIEMVRPLGVLP